MRASVLVLASVVLLSGAAVADKPVKTKRIPPGQAKKAGPPPGLAKKGGIPPGLAKKFGRHVPERPYVAFDPRFTDRAWFLVGDRWVLHSGFEPSVRIEVQQAITLPPVPPPIPLPPGAPSLHVVLFQ